MEAIFASISGEQLATARDLRLKLHDDRTLTLRGGPGVDFH
jgi:hypothetical protein